MVLNSLNTEIIGLDSVWNIDVISCVLDLSAVRGALPNTEDCFLINRTGHRVWSVIFKEEC